MCKGIDLSATASSDNGGVRRSAVSDPDDHGSHAKKPQDGRMVAGGSTSEAQDDIYCLSAGSPDRAYPRTGGLWGSAGTFQDVGRYAEEQADRI